LIDNLLASASTAALPKSGYYFTVAVTNPTGYTTLALPSGAGTTGTRAFCSDQNLVLFYNSTGGTCTTSANTPL
jgi:hypothetical protein